jgi:hypothetical protein
MLPSLPLVRLLSLALLVPLALLGLAELGLGPGVPPSILALSREELRPPLFSALAAGESAVAPAVERTPIFLPVIARSPSAIIQFGTGVDNQSNLVDPGTSFAYGIPRLYYQFTLVGAPGRSYHTEWSVNGARVPLLDDSGLIPSASAVFTNSFCSPDLADCAQPVPRGTYQVSLFIDDLFYQTATAVVQ